MTPQEVDALMVTPDPNHTTPDIDKVGAISAAVIAILSFLKLNFYRKSRLRQIQESLEKHSQETKAGFNRVGSQLEQVRQRISGLEHRNELEDIEDRIVQKLRDSSGNRQG